ncbi:efflux RND transporter permease subunit [Xanthomonas sacchari]|uniref:AcrB/AcrD/AcrF family protein n=1 Tax=Xanthomonas sacchari TaxID=56458 RepID=A0A2P5Z088_9XANT|nr:efflux RND transporter permease subunit [Xanthomonas sacchari]MDV0440270.1 efflux RND transporter permease subunit [Xanthomonas sacchari]PPU80699.1 AcrB/AcrD/AcrF family protein [Xanthomonas sacchari]
MATGFGMSGRLAAFFQANPLTPMLALLGLLLGLAAVAITPREEEPQIDVTMANVFVSLPGADAREVEQLLSTPLEQKLDEIEGIKHVYSVSRPGQAVLTVEFQVGVPRQTALVRLYNQVYSNLDVLPTQMGASAPLVKPKGIDDVPVMSVTLWSDDPQRSAADLGAIARTLETDLKRLPGTRDIYSIGAPPRVVTVTLDPARLAAYDLTVADLGQALQGANVVRPLGDRIGGGRAVPLSAGRFLADADAVRELVIGVHDGRPLQLRDVAQIQAGADLPTAYVWYGAPPTRGGPAQGRAPAVTLAIAKKSGSDASALTRAVSARLQALRGELLPQGVHAEVTRDYGASAAAKAAKLIHKLVFATASVVLLVLFALGWREAIVVGSAVVLTLALTLFASWAMGFTLNRVSLFALIFSIGILVDDAIVVVENIHRHLRAGGKTLREAIPPAVDEVGGPTILATFTVIAALMPMAFVSGLMGPYMRPIPINASVGMLLSLAIALVVTPWLALKLLKRHVPAHAAQVAAGNDAPPRLQRVFGYLLHPFLDPIRGARRRGWLFAGIAALLLAAVGLVGLQWVVLKMLPFDDKSELQIVVDLPEGSTVQDTDALLVELAGVLDRTPEVHDYQGYAGTSAPVNFNGLVRQYFLRSGNTVGDLQVNLVDKHQRTRHSHAIARALRPPLAAIARRHGASLKVVEVPPGPPVLSPLVAEVYGPDYPRSRQLALALERRFLRTPNVVDVDTSVESAATRETLVVDRVRAARLGVSQASIADALTTAVQGLDVTWLHDGTSKVAQPVRLRLPGAAQAASARLLALRVRGGDGQLVPLSELVAVQRLPWDDSIAHKDLRPVVYVTGDEAGRLDSPLYGMFDLVGQLRGHRLDGQTLQQYFIAPPTDTADFAVKWDGEWQITYETFRDMGIAYAVGLLLIYLLVVAQFRSYLLPLVIMAPIPLTVIGVMPGHALLGAQFTATSMIGMIALAGIIVRNSILLVDFIRHALAQGRSAEQAVIEACAVRAPPIVLTGLAAMLGALFILDDPIFNGLAVALLFGILVSTALTLLVIPLLYYPLARREAAA